MYLLRDISTGLQEKQREKEANIFLYALTDALDKILRRNSTQ